MGEVNTVVQLIQNVGFPIAMCASMAWYVYHSNSKHREEIRELNERHYNEMMNVTAAINNNTVALEKLCVLVDRENDNEVESK